MYIKSIAHLLHTIFINQQTEKLVSGHPVVGSKTLFKRQIQRP